MQRDRINQTLDDIRIKHNLQGSIEGLEQKLLEKLLNEKSAVSALQKVDTDPDEDKMQENAKAPF